MDSQLQPRSQRLVSVAWALAFVLAVWGGVLVAYQNYARYQEVSRPSLALGLMGRAEGGRIMTRIPSRVEHGRVVEAAKGVVVAVDGKPAPTAWPDIQRYGRLLGSAPGPVVQVTLQATDGSLQTFARTRSAALEQALYGAQGLSRAKVFWAGFAQLVLSELLGLAAAAVLFIGARRSRTAMLFSFALLVNVCGGAAAPLIYYEAQPWAPLFGVIRPVLVAAFWDLLAVVILVFPSGRIASRWAWPVLALLPFHFVAEVLAAFFVVEHPVMPFLTMALMGLAVAVLLDRYRRLPPGAQRHQVRWVLLGFGAGVVFGLLGAWSATVRIGDAAWGPWMLIAGSVFASLSAICAWGGLLISLLRYRLYDVDLVISRSAGYALLTLALAGVWAGAEKALEVLLEGRFGHEAGAASAGLAAAIAALVVTPAHHRVLEWTDHVFQRRLAQLKRDLPDLLSDLRETEAPADIAAAAVRSVREALRASRVAILLRDGTQVCAGGEPDASVDWRAPISPDDGSQAGPWLLVGPREDGARPARDDLQAVRTVLPALARALEVAERRRGQVEALERRIARLEQALARRRRALAS